MTALYSIGDFVGMVERPLPRERTANLWFLLRLHPNYDMKAERQLRDRGVVAYVPKEKRSIKVSRGKTVLRDAPIFAGGMFVPDFEADLMRLKSIASGIGGFVRHGTEPMKISLSNMERIRAFEAKCQVSPRLRKFVVGQEVRVTSGSFEMWEGRISRLDRHHRLSVLINTLAGEFSVELDEDQVEAV
jgi:transcriptional antiterminator NusG